LNAVTLETKGLSPALLAKLDPHLIWALISDFKDYRSAIGGRFDLMAELQAHKSAADVQALLTPLNANIAAQMVTAYALHAPINFVSLSVNRKEFLALLADPIVRRLQLATSLIAPRSAPRAAPQVNAATPSKPIHSPADTLLAVIDDGCPFAHQMFTRHGRYRLRALWDQDRHPDFGPIGCAVKDFSYGAVADQAALQKHIRAHTVAGVVNEQACYQALGYQSALRAYSHGAHSLGMLLDGPRLGPGAQPTFADVHAQSQFDLVFVQLPRGAHPWLKASRHTRRCPLANHAGQPQRDHH
jgi:hypothetical protein